MRLLSLFAVLYLAACADGPPGETGADSGSYTGANPSSGPTYAWFDRDRQRVTNGIAAEVGLDGYVWGIDIETGDIWVWETYPFYASEDCSGEPHFQASIARAGQPFRQAGGSMIYIRRYEAMSHELCPSSYRSEGECYAYTSCFPAIGLSETEEYGPNPPDFSVPGPLHKEPL